ncbi:MAG: hypothetical protein ACR2JB_07970 [Bryobacteraceae bacterium]
MTAERSGKGSEIIFRTLDPSIGSGRELARFKNEHANDFGSDISPDGSTVALFRQLDNRLRLLSLRNDSAISEIRVKGDTHLTTISWAASGKGWFGSNHTQEGADFLYIDLQGNTRRLWHLDGYNVLLWGRPSPDGVIWPSRGVLAIPTCG